MVFLYSAFTSLVFILAEDSVYFISVLWLAVKKKNFPGSRIGFFVFMIIAFVWETVMLNNTLCKTEPGSLQFRAPCFMVNGPFTICLWKLLMNIFQTTGPFFCRLVGESLLQLLQFFLKLYGWNWITSLIYLNSNVLKQCNGMSLMKGKCCTWVFDNIGMIIHSQIIIINVEHFIQSIWSVSDSTGFEEKTDTFVRDSYVSFCLL